MRRIALTVSLLAALGTPLAAHADALDLITLTQTSGGTGTYTYIVPASIAGATASNFCGAAVAFVLSSVPVTGPGGSSSDSVCFFVSTMDSIVIGGGLQDLSPGGLVLMNDASDAHGSLFNDNLTNPTFDLGTSGILDTYGVSNGPTYNYTITSYTPPSPTPEPSSLVLLGTGAAGLVEAYRRRRLV